MSSADYPADALAQSIERGEALIEFTLTASGQVTKVKAVRSSHPIFAAAAVGVVSQFECKSVGKDVSVFVEFSYRVE